eukprot:9164781-Pyramimonas_sp.AAC.4
MARCRGVMSSSSFLSSLLLLASFLLSLGSGLAWRSKAGHVSRFHSTQWSSLRITDRTTAVNSSPCGRIAASTCATHAA